MSNMDVRWSLICLLRDLVVLESLYIDLNQIGSLLYELFCVLISDRSKLLGFIEAN